MVAIFPLLGGLPTPHLRPTTLLPQFHTEMSSLFSFHIPLPILTAPRISFVASFCFPWEATPTTHSLLLTLSRFAKPTQTRKQYSYNVFSLCFLCHFKAGIIFFLIGEVFYGNIFYWGARGVASPRDSDSLALVLLLHVGVIARGCLLFRCAVTLLRCLHLPLAAVTVHISGATSHLVCF
eukprot:RCo032931